MGFVIADLLQLALNLTNEYLTKIFNLFIEPPSKITMLMSWPGKTDSWTDE